MTKLAFATLAVFMTFSSFASAGNLGIFTDEADDFFKAYVSDGQVDYAGIKANNAVEDLYQQLGDMALNGATAAQKKAFYINAYNIIVIRSIVARYPVNSPMDINGFFDGARHKVAGEMLTLNTLEKEKLLKAYGDARIHFAVVCAAKGCPQIGSFAFRPDQLETQLQSQTKKALNNDYFIRVQNNRVDVSKIFEWYNGDFTHNGQSVLGFINEYRDTRIPNNFTVGHYEYDWALNKQ